MIEILAHRGCWDTKMVKGNTLEAFKLAWNLGYGIETDVRDVGGEVVIEHDPFGVGKIKLEDVFKIYVQSKGERISNFSIVHRLEGLLRCNPDPNQEKLDALLEHDFIDGEGITDLLQFVDYNICIKADSMSHFIITTNVLCKHKWRAH